MGEATTLLQQIETLGFPIAIAAALLGGLWFMARWVMNVVQAKLDAQHAILVALIDRVRSMDHELIRLSVTLKLLLKIDLTDEVNRIGKCPKDEQRKD
jgi:hypothetical protein